MFVYAATSVSLTAPAFLHELTEGTREERPSWVSVGGLLFFSLFTVYECKRSNYQFHSASMTATEMTNVADRTFSQCGLQRDWAIACLQKILKLFLSSQCNCSTGKFSFLYCSSEWRLFLQRAIAHYGLQFFCQHEMLVWKICFSSSLSSQRAEEPKKKIRGVAHYSIPI